MGIGVRGKGAAAVVGTMRVVSRLEGDAPPKRLPIAASKLLSSPVLATGASWLLAPLALEKKSSMARVEWGPGLPLD
jgi:hypothetical protein